MASIKLVLGLTGVFLILFVFSGEAIHCWVCSSESDRHCADPFNASHYSLMDCDRDRSQSPYLQSLAVCRKLKKRINNEVITERSCNWEVSKGHDNGPCSQSGVASYVKLEYCSTCSTDACNGSEMKSVPFMMALVPSLTVLIKTTLQY
ncbi:UPAR/Ly6 domain-containing protein crok-like [Lycorma delicatula]|uniref:UPAR/Ly6 domain-containing protein crok-like n=1 Tax=Lycorma delicatula TaxID=130591 RepID=UPI003F515B91